jgi:hypothetical protein
MMETKPLKSPGMDNVDVCESHGFVGMLGSSKIQVTMLADPDLIERITRLFDSAELERRAQQIPDNGD